MSAIPDIKDPKVRLAIYERALEMYTEKLRLQGLDVNYNDGLCMVLPCLWLGKPWSLPWIAPWGLRLTYRDAPALFPEFGKRYPPTYPQRFEFANKTEWRIDTLTKIITSMKT